MIFENKKNNVFIKAEKINIDENTSFGNNISITVAGEFRLGKHSRIGDNTVIQGNNVLIGDHFYNSLGMQVGAGGQTYPNANLTIGDRCVIHDNVINVCEPVEIGNDVGFSGRVEVVTHGFWLSVLDGHPANFGKVKIGNGVILGFSSTILMNTEIADNITLGAHSLVSKSLLMPNAVYAGAPAKWIRNVVPIKTTEEKVMKILDIITKYNEIAKHHKINPKISFKYPWIQVNEFCCNVETFEYRGTEDNETDNFRDYFRKWGIRIYTPRPFATHFKF